MKRIPLAKKFCYRFMFVQSLIVLMIHAPVKAQKVQVGFNAGINKTIFRKSASSFGNSKFFSIPMQGIVFSIPMYLKLSPYFALKTGVNYQLKRFRVEQRDFDIDGLRGNIHYGVGYNVGEFPILLSFKPLNGKKYRLEYSTGCVLTYNSPVSNTSGSGITESEQNASISVTAPVESWESSFSPDLYVGISLTKFTSNVRNYQLTLSYQHGMAQLAESGFTTEITSGSITKKENVVLRPLISGITFTYTYFPKFFLFGK